MCGIAGIISPHANLVQQQTLQLMTNAIAHRGPDGEGFWSNEANTVALGHRRLAILDLTNAAAQPLQYLHYTLVFNGEIYNYLELKEELHAKGYAFTTASDSEIIPAAYDCWGKDCLHRFDGMFAFALYDAHQQNLFLARDRFGEKPLYYHVNYQQRGGFTQLLFASEMKALWAAGVPKDLSGTMMLNYLTLGYTQNPIKNTQTFYSNILQLPPGHYLTIQPALGKVQMNRWYSLSSQTNTNVLLTEANSIEQFRYLFQKSVSRRLRSHVQVGTSLSGGLDSASIVATIRGLQPTQALTAFTASFPGFEKDETAFSQQIAQQFQLQQHLVTVTANDWIKHWQQLTYHQEEPMQSSSVLTQWMVYGLAKQYGVKVLLDGQGADEILGGYKKYTPWFLQQLLVNDKTNFWREKKLLQQNEFVENWGIKHYAAAFFPEKAAQLLQQKAVRQQQKQLFLSPDFYYKYHNADTLQKPIVKQLEDILYYNTTCVGLQELLRYADRNSMAHSCEVRLPFLNHELVEFIFSLPTHFKMRNGFTKWILRKTMDGVLPANSNWRTNKIGFEPPQQLWMQDKNIIEMQHESRKLLVEKNILTKQILHQPIRPTSAHAAQNFDWRYLSAAAMFG